MTLLTVRMVEAIKPRDKPFKVTIDRGLQSDRSNPSRSFRQGPIGTGGVT